LLYQVIIGLAMVALTALGLWWISRHRYRCPFCGRFVKWKDIKCPHCGNDMEFRHRDTRDLGARMMTWSKSRASGGTGTTSHRPRR
jgi:DNA-directed RNA polymerase subunit RPC12/RpoP